MAWGVQRGNPLVPYAAGVKQRPLFGDTLHLLALVVEKSAVGSKLISFFGLGNSWEKWVEITPSLDIQIQTSKGVYTFDVTNRSGKEKDVGGSPVCRERLIPRRHFPWASSPVYLLKELLDFSLLTLMCLVQEQTRPSSSTPCLSG